MTTKEEPHGRTMKTIYIRRIQKGQEGSTVCSKDGVIIETKY